MAKGQDSLATRMTYPAKFLRVSIASWYGFFNDAALATFYSSCMSACQRPLAVRLDAPNDFLLGKLVTRQRDVWCALVSRLFFTLVY